MTVSLSSRREHWVLMLLAAVQFTHMMDFMLVMPLGPEFMRLFGISAASFGVLVSAYTLASAVMGLLGGLWLDRFDRKRTLLVLYAVFLAATLLCGAADGYIGLLGARTMAGACAGLMSAVIQTIIGDLIPVERRGRAIGTVMASYGLSAVVGVPLGLGLASQWGWRSPFWAIGALSAGVWLGLLVLLPAVDRHLSPARDASGTAAPAPAWTPRLALGWVLTFGVVFSGFLLISGRAIPTMALVASRVPPALRGRYLAMNMAASDGASGLGAWVSGLLITVAPDGALVGFGFVGWIAVGVTGCALFTLWTLTRRAVALRTAPA